MSIIDRLRGKLRAKSEDHKAQYWGTLQKIASGKLSERAADEALEALTTTMELLGKSADDAQADVELLEQLAEAEVRAGGRDAAQQEMRAATKANAEAQAKAEDLRRQALKLIADGQQAVTVASNRIATIEGAEQECTVLRNRLGKAGHPPSVVISGDEQARARFELKSRELETKLAQVTRELREAQATVDSNARSYPGAGEQAAATVAWLQTEVERLQREQAELRREEEIRVASRRKSGKALGGVS